MSYKLEHGEKLSRGIRRIETRQVRRITKDLVNERPKKRGKMVHEARKEIKKARSVLRMIRGRISDADYQKANRNLRKVGQAFSPWRDAEVALKTLNKLREDCRKARATRVLDELGEILQKCHDEILRHVPAVSKIKKKLRAARQRIKKLDLEGLSRSDLICGSQEIYRRGREALQEAELTHAPENLHEWRKRVKDLWHQLRILRPTRPVVGAEFAREMKKLSDFLGADHDLVMLQEAARKAELGKAHLELLARQVDLRRKKLQGAAFELGHRLFAGKPAVFARRIRYRGKKHRR